MGRRSKPRDPEAITRAELGSDTSATNTSTSASDSTTTFTPLALTLTPTPGNFAAAEKNEKLRLPKVTCQSSHVYTRFELQEKDGQGLRIMIDGKLEHAIWHHELVARLDTDTYGTHLYETCPPRRNRNQSSRDVTAFLPRQKRWDFDDKAKRPDIVFQLYPNAYQFRQRWRPVPCLQIDLDGVTTFIVDIVSRLPLRFFDNLPLQLATNVEGGRLEAMCREDCRIITDDFLHRMIPLLNANGVPLRNENGAILHDRPSRNSLNNVKTQFRNKCRCLSWNSKHHDSEFDRLLLSELTDEDREANTTRNLPDLSTSQVTEVRSIAKGRKSAATSPTKVSNNGVFEEANIDQATESAFVGPLTEEQSHQESETPLANYGSQSDSKILFNPVASTCLAAREIPKRARGRPRKPNPRANNVAISTPSKKTLYDDSKRIDPALLSVGSSTPPMKIEVQHGSRIIDTAPLGCPFSAPPLKSEVQNVSMRTGHDISPSPAAPSAVRTLPTDDDGNFRSPIVPEIPVAAIPSHEPVPAKENFADSDNLTKTQLVREKPEGRVCNILSNDGKKLKRNFSALGEAIVDHVEGISEPEAKSHLHSQKRQKIISPTGNLQQLLKDFAATSRPGAPTSNNGGIPQPGSSSKMTSQNARNSQSPSKKNSHPAPPYQAASAFTLVGQLTRFLLDLPEVSPESPQSTAPTMFEPVSVSMHHSPPRSIANSPPPNRPRPYPPTPAAQGPTAEQYDSNSMRAEQVDSALVSTKIADLEAIKAYLLESWWRAQPDISQGGGLYGPIFTISLSQLGPTSSARTDTEMRSFMSSFHIPTTWSATDIDLRQHQALRQVVHKAMGEAERWDSRNYLPHAANNRLDLEREGGFFLARSQLYLTNRNDSRFWSFASTPRLNSCLHTALWRFKQLTCRDYHCASRHDPAGIRPPAAAPLAFQTLDTTYHDAWVDVRLQLFLPYFLRFADPVEAVFWMPTLGILRSWEGGPERWEKSASHVQDEFHCKWDRDMGEALDPRRLGERWGRGVEGSKRFLPVWSVDLQGEVGLG